MRMHQHEAVSPREWLRTVSVEDLSCVLHNFGEDDDALLSERIAESILARQRELGGMIKTTRELADIIRHAKSWVIEDRLAPPKWTFQANRAFFNQEMEQLDNVMDGAMRALVNEGPREGGHGRGSEGSGIRWR